MFLSIKHTTVNIVGTVLATTFTHTAQTGLENSQLLSSNSAYRAIRNQIIQKLQVTDEFGQGSLQNLIPQNAGASSQTKPPGKGSSSEPTASPVEPSALNQEVITIFKNANAAAVKNVGWVATLFVALGTLSAFMLPNPDFNEETILQKQPLPPPENTININDIVDEASFESFPASDPPAW